MNCKIRLNTLNTCFPLPFSRGFPPFFFLFFSSCNRALGKQGRIPLPGYGIEWWGELE